MQTKTYKASAAVLVETPLASAATGTGPNMGTEEQVATSGAVAQMVADSLHSRLTAGQIARGLSVTEPFETNILDFNYSAANPLDAMRRAQAFATQYVNFRQRLAQEQIGEATASLNQQITSLTNALIQASTVESATPATDGAVLAQARAQAASLTTQIGVLEEKLASLTPGNETLSGKVVQNAVLPTKPARPLLALNLLVGLLLGLLLGIGAALARDRLDDRVRGQFDLTSRLGIPVLTVVPPTRRRGISCDLVVVEDPGSRAAERIRQLGSNLMLASQRTSLTSILITSVDDGDGVGKSFVGSNLGASLGQAGCSVILVSADFDRGQFEEALNLGHPAGLAEALSDQAPWRSALVECSAPNLKVLPSGLAQVPPAALLTPDSMRQLLQDVSGFANYMIVVGPALSRIADNRGIMRSCDAVLFVATARRTTRESLTRAREDLRGLGTPILGSVLIDSDEAPSTALWGDSLMPTLQPSEATS
jgi:capsular exopolysaccharide synthesis family protein